jgi:hypothetical protein
MSTIKTLSRFYWGHTITSQNKALDFNEGAGELRANLKAGAYSATEFAAEIQRAMREVGSQNYVVSFNRTTRKITISAPITFSLLAGSGSRIGIGVWSLAGFTATDKTGTTIYTSENVSGNIYDPQYYLNEYKSDIHSIVLEDATADATPLGIAQIAKFGDGSRLPMNIRLITNLTLKNSGFVINANGVNNFIDFIRYCMNKGRVEFMPDKDTPSQFTKCYLESTSEDKDARRFELKNMSVDIYESGVLVFRKVLT